MPKAPLAKQAAIDLVMERAFPLPRERAWQILSETDRINKAIGLDPVSKQTPLPGRISRAMTSTALRLLPMAWQEYPFEWMHGRWYEVYRHYSRGPMRTFRSGIRLSDVDLDGTPGTMVQLYSMINPANVLMLAPVKLIAKQSMDKTFRFIESAMAADARAQTMETLLSSKAALTRSEEPTDSLARDAEDKPRPAVGRSHKANEVLLAEKLNRLRGLGYSEKLIMLAGELIRYGHEAEIADIRPYALADRWKAGRTDVLKMMLQSTRLGLFNMEWQLICPNCRVSDTASDKLADIGATYHCDYCGIDYEVAFDRYVELCFAVHPEIRRVTRALYCIGAPAFSPHIHAQRIVPGGGSIEFELPGSPIDWQLRVSRSNERSALKLTAPSSPEPAHVAGAFAFGEVAAAAEVIATNEFDAASEFDTALASEVGAGVRAGAGATAGDRKSAEIAATAVLGAEGWLAAEVNGSLNGRLRVANDRDHDAIVVIERQGWDDVVATASQVTLFPEFRAMYGSDVLAPGQQAGISSLTVLFTDLCGSTAYYETVGDASAYGYVRQMFDFMTVCVQNHGGAVVKTIGDAVMAVFDGAEAGFRAALAIQSGWHSGERESLNQGLDLRIGLHHGPAVMVGMNGRNDYFGRTVNMAARIQAVGGPSEIVLEAELFERQIARDPKLSDALLCTDPFMVELKGVHEPVKLVRVLLRGGDVNAESAV